MARELLEHADFIRRLTRSLVSDPNTADDLEQQTWLAALEGPLPKGDAARSWIVRVVRNFLKMRHRSESRRLRHEASAAELNMNRDANTQDREEWIQAMTLQLSSLEEAYRVPLILRYYEGLSLAEIAKRIDLPAPTVKTRLRRGLQKLRARLDSQYAGDRKKWMALALPMALARPPRSFMLSSLIPLSFAAVVIVAVSVFSFLDSTQDSGPSDVSSSMSPDEQDSPLDSNGLGPKRKDLFSTKENAIADDGRLIVRVTDQVSGEPLQRFDLLLMRLREGPDELFFHQTIQTEDGTYRFNLPHGEYRPILSTSQHCRHEHDVLSLDAESSTLTLEIALDPGLEVHGRVLDAHTGLGVASAIVGSAQYPIDTQLEWIRRGFAEYGPHARTDRDGYFTLRGIVPTDDAVSRRARRIAAIHDQFAEGFIDVVPGEGQEVSISLQRGHRIRGVVLDDEGNPIEDALIRLTGPGLPMPRIALTDKHGRYQSPPLSPGVVHLMAQPRVDDDHGQRRLSADHRQTVLGDEELELNFAPDDSRYHWEGVLRNEVGDALPFASIILSPSRLSDDELEDFRLYQTIQCDQDGRFRHQRLAKGLYQVEVYLSDEKGLIRSSPLDLDRSRHEDFQLGGHRLRGRVGGPASTFVRGTVHALHEGRARKHQPWASIRRDGTFEFVSLAPGIYDLRTDCPDFPAATLHGITIPETSPKTHVLELESGGRLEIRLAGFGQSSPREFLLSLQREDKDSRRYHLRRLSPQGHFLESRQLHPGSWIVSFAMGDHYLARRFEITPNQTTSFDILKTDFHPSRSHTVKGQLLDHAGLSLPDQEIVFYAQRVPNHSRKERTTLTDFDGRFRLELPSGHWRVERRRGDSQTSVITAFADLFLSPGEQETRPLALVDSGSVLLASLWHLEEGRPLSQQDPPWWAFLVDQRTGRIASSLQGGHHGSDLRMLGAPEGRYRLFIKSRASTPRWMSEPFEVKAQSVVDLGALHLSIEPSDRLP